MSLIFLAADFPPSRGGIQTVSYELPLALQQAGQEVGLITVAQPGAGEFDETVPYAVARVPGDSKWQIATNLSAGVVELFDRLQTKPTAVIATKWFPEGLSAVSARKLLKCPVVMIGHGREFHLTGFSPLKWMLQKYILKQVDIAIGVSEWTAGELRKAGIRRNRIHVVNNGIRTDRFAEPRDTQSLRDELGIGDEPVLLTVGRLVMRKGHAQVLHALREVIEQVGPVTYVVAGSGDMDNLLRDTAAGYGIQEHVRFVGDVTSEDLPTYYQLCDAFVMPTQDIPGDPLEGFGIVYLEANAAGKPVIGTRCGGVADAIEDGVSGLLIPPEDTGTLTEAIIRLLTDRDLAKRLGEGGRRRIDERFTWDKIARQFLSALGDAGKPAAT